MRIIKTFLNRIRREFIHIFSRTVLTFYWRGKRNAIDNFGDQLNIDLLKHFGLHPVHATPAQAEIFAIGSILQICPETYDGIIAGSGYIKPELAKSHGKAKILALRGPLTNLYEGKKIDTLCDPGIISKIIFGQFEKKFDYGIVPHWRDVEDTNLKIFIERNSGVKVIDVCKKPVEVVKDIAQCEIIFSSSLHGLVVADSYNIPAVWLNFNDRQTGGEFKFNDYHESLGITRNRIQFSEHTTIELLCKSAVKTQLNVIDEKINSLVNLYNKLYYYLIVIRVKRIFKRIGLMLILKPYKY